MRRARANMILLKQPHTSPRALQIVGAREADQAATDIKPRYNSIVIYPIRHTVNSTPHGYESEVEQKAESLVCKAQVREQLFLVNR